MNQREVRHYVLRLAAQDLEAHQESGSDMSYCPEHSDRVGDADDCADCARVAVAWKALIVQLRAKCGR